MAKDSVLGWQATLILEAAHLGADFLHSNEEVVAAARTRSGLPAILLFAVGVMTLGVASVILGIVWPSAIGRGMVLLTDQRLLLLDVKKRTLTLQIPLTELQAKVVRRPLLDDLLTLRYGDQEIRVHLAGDSTLLRQTLAV